MGGLGGVLREGQGFNGGDWRMIRDNVNMALKKNKRPLDMSYIWVS